MTSLTPAEQERANFGPGFWRGLAALDAKVSAPIIADFIANARWVALEGALEAQFPGSIHGVNILTEITRALTRTPAHRQEAEFAAARPLIGAWIQAMVAEQVRMRDKSPLVAVALACVEMRDPLAWAVLNMMGETQALDWRACLRDNCGRALLDQLTGMENSQNVTGAMPLLAILPATGAGVPEFRLRTVRSGAPLPPVPLNRAIRLPKEPGWTGTACACQAIAAGWPDVAAAWSADVSAMFTTQKQRFSARMIAALLFAQVRLTDEVMTQLREGTFTVVSNSALKKYATFAGLCAHRMNDADMVKLLPHLTAAGIPLDAGTKDAPWNTPLYAAAERGHAKTMLALLELGANPEHQRPGVQKPQQSVLEIVRTKAKGKPGVHDEALANLRARLAKRAALRSLGQLDPEVPALTLTAPPGSSASYQRGSAAP